ncbi:SAP domain, partial [Dillenia turbinata]
MSARGKKRSFVDISSSSDEDDDSEFEDEVENSDDDVISISDSSSYDDDDGTDSGEDQDRTDSDEGEQDDESRCNKVIGLLQEGSELEGLNVNECKAYLRRHGLRISGTKAVCIQRIQEHWRIKDGNGEVIHPVSSFSTNCKGDVCKGDVVLFVQKVYKKFDKVTKTGKLLGRRTVAGRVVKESYGASKQQHTFTRWDNEAERLEVLAEKHNRGNAARLVREMRKAKKSSVKCQKHFHQAKSSQLERTTESGKGRRVDAGQKASRPKHAKSNDRCHKAPRVENMNNKRNSIARPPKSSRKYQRPNYPSRDMHHNLYGQYPGSSSSHSLQGGNIGVYPNMMTYNRQSHHFLVPIE